MPCPDGNRLRIKTSPQQVFSNSCSFVSVGGWSLSEFGLKQFLKIAPVLFGRTPHAFGAKEKRLDDAFPGFFEFRQRRLVLGKFFDGSSAHSPVQHT